MATYVPKDPWLARVMAGSGPLGCILFMFLWLFAMLPLAPLLILRQRRRHAWFIRSLREQRRLQTWADFVAAVRGQPGGAVIIEVGNKCPTRFWRTPEPVRSLSPVEPRALADLDLISFGGSDYHPFARWCYERYLAPDGGTAVLAHPEEADFETWPFDTAAYEQQMRREFGGSDVSVITFYDTRFIRWI